MKTYEFTVELVERVDSDDDVERLCAVIDDGTMVTSEGVTRIDSHREASSLQEAIGSVIADIGRCGFRVARVTSEETELIEEINASLAASGVS